MITKNQLNQILFIQKHIKKRDLFLKELFKNLSLYNNEKLTKEQFNLWLDSWEATAELDQDPNASKRINEALKKTKAGKTPYKSWKEFKESIGLS